MSKERKAATGEKGQAGEKTALESGPTNPADVVGVTVPVSEADKAALAALAAAAPEAAQVLPLPPAAVIGPAPFVWIVGRAPARVKPGEVRAVVVVAGSAAEALAVAAAAAGREGAGEWDTAVEAGAHAVFPAPAPRVVMQDFA